MLEREVVTLPEPSVEPSKKWVRVRLGDTTIAESRSPVLLLEYAGPPHLPTYYFSPNEVDSRYLANRDEMTDGSTRWDVETGSDRAAASTWTHPDPTGDLSAVEGMITFDWFGDLSWFEEEEQVHVHAKDPHQRVDVLESSRHLVVSVDGVNLADTDRPHLLFETMLPVRYYLPAEDVRMDLLSPSDTVTACPYKGVARYWSYAPDGADPIDVAWSYLDPIPENPRIKDLICFYNEQVDISVDGENLPRPVTPWSS